MKIKKVITLTLTFMFLMSSFVCAAPTDIRDVIGGDPVATPPGDSSTLVSKILGTFQFIGYAIAIGMLIYVGIKYTLAAADGKADLKSSMIKYVVGAIIIAAADVIFGWIIGLA